MGGVYITFVVAAYIGGVLTQYSRNNLPEETTLTFSETAKIYGYQTEEYDITSQGYILKVFRIPGNKSRPLLFIHGAMDSSDGFIIRGNTSMAIAMARDNYDVWAMNYRGNMYSRRHTKLNPNLDEEYWNFSLHEIGYYDVPTIIDFILNKTGEQRLSVIGYSEGTASMYVLGATRPEYNDKIKIMISLAPICYLQNVGKYFSAVFEMGSFIYAVLESIHSREFFGNNSVARALLNALCTPKEVGYTVCLQIIVFPVVGPNAKEIELEFFPNILGHFPAGTSIKNIHHLVQIYKNGRFANYDYGTAENLAIYNKLKPPLYDLSKVTMKIALVVAKNDQISTIRDTELLRKRLPNVVDYVIMKDSAFNHIDYIWGRNSHKTLFPHISRILKKYDSL